MLFMHTGAGTLALGGSMLQRGAGSQLFSITLGSIVSIIPTVAAQAQRAQFKDSRYLGQQLTVVRGHQHPALIPGKLLVEPLAALPVEVVGRFVQQQVVSIRGECAAQQGTNALATAQLCRAFTRVKRGKFCSDKSLAQPFSQIPITVERVEIVGFIMTSVDARARRKDRVVTKQFGKRGIRRNILLLRHVDVCTKAFNMTAGGFINPCQQTQQPCFAAAVSANQCAH